MTIMLNCIPIAQFWFGPGVQSEINRQTRRSFTINQGLRIHSSVRLPASHPHGGIGGALEPLIIVENPNSEIKMAGMRQDVGAETLWKNRRHTRSGLVKFFQTVYAQEIDADRPF